MFMRSHPVKIVFLFLHATMTNAVTIILGYTYFTMVQHTNNFPYVGNEELNKRICTGLLWCSLFYCFGIPVVLFISHLVSLCVIHRDYERSDYFKWPFVWISIPFQLQCVTIPLLRGFLERDYNKFLAGFNIAKMFLSVFLYVCMIPFLSIVYYKRHEHQDTNEYDSDIRLVRDTIILITVKLVFDIHLAVVQKV